ncbi:hypothetical protein WJX84_009807 [Apatococcus fuscideae]|uniref:Cilia-and flagella-associated protein 96 n=1 Tax=Apatococcus fuscideae TaxID=2026836 RepID=A0AAW1T7R7_9CHLO
MTTKYDVFIEPGILSPGATYARSGREDIDKIRANNQAGFRIQVPRSGKLNDATFGKYATIHGGDKYEDAAKSALQGRGRARGVGGPFKLTGPGKRSTGPNNGDFYGSFAKIPYESPFADGGARQGDTVHTRKNFLTGPGKKGGYGFNKTTLSERQGYKGVAGEYAYMSDPIKSSTGSKYAKEKGPTPAFKPPQLNSKGVFANIPYVETGQPKVLIPRRKTDGAAFKPAYSGPGRPFARYPEHMADPSHEPHQHKEEGPRAPWKCTYHEHTGAYRSIVKMNL